MTPETEKKVIDFLERGVKALEEMAAAQKRYADVDCPQQAPLGPVGPPRGDAWEPPAQRVDAPPPSTPSEGRPAGVFPLPEGAAVARWARIREVVGEPHAERLMTLDAEERSLEAARAVKKLLVPGKLSELAYVEAKRAVGAEGDRVVPTGEQLRRLVEGVQAVPSDVAAAPVACKSCGASIAFVKTKAGRAMPVDLERTREAGQVVVTDDGDVVKTTGDVEGRRSHFATCPGAEAHRRVRKL